VTSPQADEAIQIFSKKFPFDRPPPSESNLVRIGMPSSILGGPPPAEDASKPRRRLTDVNETTARETFAELADLYGAAEAVEMVKNFPLALALKRERFGPALAEFGKIFGEEQAEKMVQRNPCLLAVSPEDAATSTDQTMIFSYLVGYTRPLGPILTLLLTAALSVPVIEGVTGVSKNELFAYFLGQ